MLAAECCCNRRDLRQELALIWTSLEEGPAEQGSTECSRVLSSAQWPSRGFMTSNASTCEALLWCGWPVLGLW